jgi:hypothetical protein
MSARLEVIGILAHAGGGLAKGGRPVVCGAVEDFVPGARLTRNM